MKKYLLTLLIVMFSLTNQASAQALCSDPSQESPYVNCILNEGYIGCQAASPSCDYYDYYITPRDAVSKMINQCCRDSFSGAQQRSCFQTKLREVRLAKALPLRFRQQTRSIVTGYINNPEVFCTEH